MFSGAVHWLRNVFSGNGSSSQQQYPDEPNREEAIFVRPSPYYATEIESSKEDHPVEWTSGYLLRGSLPAGGRGESGGEEGITPQDEKRDLDDLPLVEYDEHESKEHKQTLNWSALWGQLPGYKENACGFAFNWRTILCWLGIRKPAPEPHLSA